MDKRKLGLSMTFVGNDDVMAHIINAEEVSAKKVRKSKVQTLASAEPPSQSTPSSRKRLNHSKASHQDDEDDDQEEDGRSENGATAADDETKDSEASVPQAKKSRKSKPQAPPSTDTPSRPVRSSRKQVNYCESRQPKGEIDEDDDEEEEEEDESRTGDSDGEKEGVLTRLPEVLLDRSCPLGTEVFSFKTPKRAGKMAAVAAESVDRRRSKRAALKRKSKRPLGQDRDDSDFSSGQSSDDGDDDEDYEDKDDLNSDTSSERSITMSTRRRRGASPISLKDLGTLKQGVTSGVKKSVRKCGRGNSSSVQPHTVEEYFVAHAGQAVTSDHTLARLENPQMASDQLAAALESAPNSYTKEMRELFEEHRASFNKWMYHLSNGYNLLLYGLGSKRRLLDVFCSEMIPDFSRIVINGYFPSLTIKSILNAISDDIVDDVCNHRNMTDQLEFIEDKLEEMDEPLFLIIHNLDGAMLRASKIQSVMSRLAQISNVHILASIDHINAPLIWDQERSSTFSWLWYDVTTFDPYTDETSYENSLLVQQSGMLALSSLTHILRSLTPNARGIFNILVEFQLEHRDDGTYNGMSFHELYQKCREAFLVNSDLTLRAQLTEFRDHKLIRSKKSLDGMELLSIPLDNSTLVEFQQQEEL
ncbi:origin recognition complex subunit 2-like [Diadema setosum]|uniref:origin recognition complex subunit 2-like n=1 Tax=Diadema setosum TaxID=31175 RepID=UPI003B3B788D